MAVLEGVAKRLLRSIFVDLGTDTVIIYVSLILPDLVSFFHKNEGTGRFVIAFKIVIGLCYFSPLP